MQVPQVRVRHPELLLKSPSPILLVCTFFDAQIAAECWHELSRILSDTADRLMRFERSVLITVAGAAEAEQVKQAIAQFQGTIAIENSDPEEYIYVSFTAEAPDLQTANEIAEEMQLYFGCNHSQLCLRPPWIHTPLSSQQKEREYRSRYTFTQLTDSRSLKLNSVLVYGLIQLILGWFLRYNLERYHRLMSRQAEKETERAARRVLALGDPRIDAETVALFIEHGKQQNRRDNSRNLLDNRAVGATLALGQRLGQMRLENGCPIPEDSERSADCGWVKQQENCLIFEDLGFRNIHEGLLALLVDLRDRGFKKLHSLAWVSSP